MADPTTTDDTQTPETAASDAPASLQWDAPASHAANGPHSLQWDSDPSAPSSLSWDDAQSGPAPSSQPYKMPNGRLIDPDTHTGGIPNPHAVAPIAPLGATVGPAPPQTLFERARQYVANSGPGETLETYAPSVSRALNLEPTESETARQQRESDTSAFEYHPVEGAKQVGKGLMNLADSGVISPSPTIPAPYENPALTPSDKNLHPNFDQAAQGASQVMSGAMAVGKPLVVAGVAAAPTIKAAIYYGAGILAGKGSAQVAQSMGATPNEVEFFNTAGFFIPGALTAAAGIEAASIPDEARVIDPVTHEPVPVRGGAVGGKGFGVGHAVTDTGEHILQARVGPYSAQVRFGRTPQGMPSEAPTAPSSLGQGEVLPPAPQPQPDAVALQQRAQQATIEETAAAAQTIDLKSAQAAGLAPPPPPAPAPGQPGSKQVPLPAGMESGQLSQQVVENAGKAISSLPPAVQPKGVLEATGNLAKWMFSQKTFVGPDGKVVNVDSQKAAQTEAVNLINNEVDRQKGISEDNEKTQKNALDKQQADAEKAASEREEARQDAEKNQPPEPLPDTPAIAKVRQALAKTPPDMPKSDLVMAARKAAAAGPAPFLLPHPIADRLADEHIATRAQQETAAGAGITGEKLNPDQDPIALGKMATDVQSGKAAFLQVAPGTKFKPDGLTKENGFIYTDVKKAQDPTFNGRYYHPKEIPAKAVKAALSGPSPLSALQQLELEWRAGRTLKTPEKEGRSVLAESPEETQLGNPAPATEPAPIKGESVTEGAKEALSRPPQDTETKAPLSYADEVHIYGEASKAVKARGIKLDDPEVWGAAIAEEEARILAERNGEKLPEAKPTEAAAKPGEVVPSSTGNAQPEEKQGETSKGPITAGKFSIFDNKTGKRISSDSYATAEEANHDYHMNSGATHVGTVVNAAEQTTFNPGDKVTIKSADGTQRLGEVRIVLPNKKLVLKGERKPVAVGDVSPAEVIAPIKTEADAVAPVEEHADLAATLYSNPLDPELFKRLIGQPLMKMAEPLREELATRGHIADVANDVHDALQNLDRTNRATTLEAKGITRSLLKAGFTNEDGKAVFANLEDPAIKLTPKQEELRDEWIKPLNQVTRAQYVVTELIKSGKFKLDDILAGKVPEEETAKIVPPDEGGYQHRIPVEKDTFVDKLLGDSLKRFRAPGNVLSRIFPSAKRSIFKEAHGPNGEREVVAVKNGRVTQFVSQDNAAILDKQIAEAQKELAAAKGNPQRQIELSNQIEGLEQKADAVKAGGHATLDLGPHVSGYVSTAKLADDAVAPLEAKLDKLQTEFHTLHGSQKRALASQQRIENLYYQIDGLEKNIAAVRASIGPEQEAEEGLSRQQALEGRVKPLQDQIEKLTEKQAELAARETNTRWGERQLKSIPGRIQDLKDRIEAISDEMAGQGLEGKYWRDKNGDLWKFDRGTTEFISSRTGQQYHADARLAGIVNYMETNKAMNAAVVLERAKGMLESQDMALKTDNSKDAPEGWKQTSLPQMRGYYFPDHVADAFDQFHYLQQRGAPNVLEMANNFVIQSVLMNPLYHGLNIGSNWFAGKEAEALAGKGISPSFYADNVKAGIEAANMMKDWGGPEYQRLLRLGLDLRGADAGFDTQTKEILRSFTDQLDADKPSNAAMSALIGVKNAAQFMRKMNHQITFGMGDLALAQSFYAKRAQLIRDGVPNAEEAARDWAHRIVGEYTTPIRLAGSAGLGRLAENPLAQSFFRYHFGYILRPLATAVRESLGEFKSDEEASEQVGKETNEFGQSPVASRTLAIARLAALVIMATYVFPKILDQAAKKLTNDERAQAPRGGLLKFATDAYETATGERSIASLAGSVFTPGLGSMQAVELGANRDDFTGRHIYGSDQDADGKAKQVLSWLWKGTLPGQQTARMDQSGLRQTVEALLGFKFPVTHGIKEAVEIRRDEGGSNPPDPDKTKVFQSIMAAAEQSHRSQGQDTSLHDALLESGKLTASEKQTLREAIHEPPVVFAVRGLEHPQDYWQVFEHSTDEEKAALLHDHGTRHKMNIYQKELRTEGKTDEANSVLQAITK